MVGQKAMSVMVKTAVRIAFALYVLGVVSVSSANADLRTPLADSRTPGVAARAAWTSQPATPEATEVPATTRPVPLITLVGFIALGIAVVLILFRDPAEARALRSTHHGR